MAIDFETARRFILGKQGLWLEDKCHGKDDAFVEALVRGFVRFVKFLGASSMDAMAISEPLLRRRVSNVIASRREDS